MVNTAFHMFEEQAQRDARLRSQVEAFCNAFLSGDPPGSTLDKLFVPSNPKITEHGPPWASSRLPFLGRTFVGRSKSTSSGATCDDYFTLLGQTLRFHPSENTFPPVEQFVVDSIANAVSVVAHARFESIKTGKSWEEDFIYRLSGFDQEGRIGHWEIWADPLSAWEAVGAEGEKGTGD